MAGETDNQASANSWPRPPAGRDVVLHTRVVTETGGGPDKTILLSASFLAETNYWLAAAYMHPPGDAGFEAIRKRAAAAGCPLVGVPDRGPLDRSVLRTLRDICRRMNVRIWHGHDYKSNLLGLALRPFWSMKLVTTVHGWVKHTSRTPLYYAIDRWCLPYYHHVMTVSDDLHEQVLKLGVPPQRCTLLVNGVDEAVFSRRHPAEQSPLRARLGTPAGRLVVGAMGRLSPEKAFNNLIHATGALVGQGLDMELWIAGEGDSRADLQRLIAHLGLADRVRLLGFCDDPVGFYHGLDVFALSSLREGLPNVVLEAMAMGLAVVSTAVAGVPRLVRDRDNGLLVQMGEVEPLAEALAQTLRDADLRARLGRSARETIERDFTFRRRMDRERAVYDQVLGRPGATDAAAGPAGGENPSSGRQSA